MNLACVDADLLNLTLHPTVPESLYAGTLHGFFISADSGVTWQAHNEGLISDWWMVAGNITIHPVKRDHIYITYSTLSEGGMSSKGGGIFRSLNAGATWEQVPYSFFYLVSGFSYPTRTIGISRDGSTLYASLLFKGIYKYLLGDL